MMISHDLEASLRYASHFLHIGNQLFFGTRAAYLASDLGRSYAKGEEKP